MNPNDEIFGAPIYSYSRSQAIEDGMLVDISQLEIVKQHWKLPCACSSSVWGIIDDATVRGFDRIGILHDLFTLAKAKIPPSEKTNRLYFKAVVAYRTYDFVLHCGPGDDALPVLTLMLPSDD
ncbi:MAG: hypothetical protein HZA93_08170 [Verrucomicrobia bacterium]|nr:hypothetical protein [Verrucomicrobiota bacterium]